MRCRKKPCIERFGLQYERSPRGHFQSPVLIKYLAVLDFNMISIRRDKYEEVTTLH